MQAQLQSDKHPILHSERPFPEWIKKHPTIQKSKCSDKIFGRLGIPNFNDEVEIVNTEEAKQHALALIQAISPELSRQVQALPQKAESVIASTLTEEEKAKKLSSLAGLIASALLLQWQLANYPNDFVVITGKKIELKLRSDLYGLHISESETPASADAAVAVADAPKATPSPPKRKTNIPLFKKGQSLIGTYAKMTEVAKELGATFAGHEQWQQFKDFSRTNVGVNKCSIVFSHTGDEALWDIATISMRGVSSCQSWHVANSIGLIGSLASRFCGVMYLASDREVPGFGKVMLNRCMVRLAISAKTGAPAIIIDKMYQSENKETVKQFKRALAKRTSLDVIYVGENAQVATDYFLPNEANIDVAARPYLDIKFPFKDRAKILKVKQKSPEKVDMTVLASKTKAFEQSAFAAMRTFVADKRAQYEKEYAAYEKDRNAYSLAKMKWEEEDHDKSEKFSLKAPKMNADLSSFFKGGVETLFKYVEKHSGTAPSDAFGRIILDAVKLPDMAGVQTKEAYHRRFLLSFIKDATNVKVRAWKKCQEGPWMKSFPRSSERFFSFVFAQMKSAALASIKELFKEEA